MYFTYGSILFDNAVWLVLSIINIEKMKPLTLDIHCSKAKAVYALEMNESWFEKNHVKPGDKISRLPLPPQTN